VSRAWMPLYVADYLADTGHLSRDEHGAYLLLIMHYWQKGALPNDDAQLARICRATAREWAGLRSVMAGFFQDGWTHPRIDHELESAKASYERRANAGRKGGNAKAMGKESDSNATAGPQQSQSQPPTLEADASKGDARKRAPRKTRIPDPFRVLTDELLEIAHMEGLDDEAARRDHARFVNWCDANGKVYADWRAAWRNWCQKAASGFGQPRGPSTNGHGQEAGGRVAAARRALSRLAQPDDVSGEWADIPRH
jgi:uncharacterized protein YdaU (DUF1376 family)